jgi:hypothetical protein
MKQAARRAVRSTFGKVLWLNRPVGMCAIYSAVPPPTADELKELARTHENRAWAANRCTLGRAAIAELVAALAPPSHAELARAIHERDLWSFLTPAATRGNHAQTLQRVHTDLAVPFPLWPSSIELACLVGAEPAHYIGNNLVMLPSDLVVQAVPVFEQHEGAHEVAEVLNAFLRKAARRRDAVLLHWDHR